MIGTAANIVPGARVRCLYAGRYLGKTGTVKRITRDPYINIYIDWDDALSDVGYWTAFEYFEVLDETTISAPTEEQTYRGGIPLPS